MKDKTPQISLQFAGASVTENFDSLGAQAENVGLGTSAETHP